MPRPPLHQTDVVLDAARDLVLSDGPRAARVRAIARRAGAPSGSLYHRFSSRDALVAEAWLRAARRFQQGFLEAASAPDAHDAVGACAAWTVAFALDQPADAQLLLAYSPQALLDAAPDRELAQALRAVNDPVADAIKRLAARTFDADDRAATEAVTRAVVDLPYALVRRHLPAGTLTPGDADAVRRAALAMTRERP